MLKVQKKWWVLFVTTSATALAFLDNTVMPVALPTIERELAFTPVGLVWIVNSYLLSLTALLLVGGRLSDLFGKRFLFMWGMFFFGIGSLIGGMSHTHWLLLLGRVLQGIGGACTIPATIALLISYFPEGERAKAIGLNTGISSVFLILGPAVGGFLTEYISWRSIFYINLPIVAFGMIMAMRVLKREKRKSERFHYSGALTMVLGVVTLVVALMQVNEWGWSSLRILALFLISAIFWGLFIFNCLKARDPLIDFNLFKNRLFTLSNITLFVTQLIVMITVLWALYFQQYLNYTALETGLLIFVSTLPVLIVAPLGGYCADKYGARIPMLIGYLILTFALFWLLFTVEIHSITILLPGLLGFGIGLPMILSPAVALGLSPVDAQKLGSASGIATAIRQLAATIGIALMTTVYQGVENATHSHVRAFSAISILGGVLSIIGFFIVLFTIKKSYKNFSRVT